MPAPQIKDVRILLADDHKLIRASLRLLVSEFEGVEVVGEATDGQEAIDLVIKHRPDVVLMDITMAGLNGLEATRRIQNEAANVRVVILSMHATEDYVLPALRAGAAGYVLKEAAPEELYQAIKAVARGEIYLSPAIASHVLDAVLAKTEPQKTSLEGLTPRQREVLQLVAEGMSSKQIALRLDASVKTIESHRASLMDKLNIHEVAGLVRYAIRNGLISADN
jgi:DNA-binding NarL/FixJ family response regulator